MKKIQQVVIVQVTKKQVFGQTYFFVYLYDISNVQSAGLMKIQNKFQSLLTNGLSHERLGPLNSMINMSELLLRKCEQFFKQRKLNEKKDREDNILVSPSMKRNSQNTPVIKSSLQVFTSKNNDLNLEMQDELFRFHKFVNENSMVIWCQSKLMHLMTTSQLDHYAIDCKNLDLVATDLQ